MDECRRERCRRARAARKSWSSRGSGESWSSRRVACGRRYARCAAARARSASWRSASAPVLGVAPSAAGAPPVVGRQCAISCLKWSRAGQQGRRWAPSSPSQDRGSRARSTLGPSDNAGPWSSRLFDATLQQPLQAALAHQLGALYGCIQLPGHCHLHCDRAGRSAMLTDIGRVNAPVTLTKAWLQAHVQAVLAGIQGIKDDPAPPGSARRPVTPGWRRGVPLPPAATSLLGRTSC